MAAKDKAAPEGAKVDTVAEGGAALTVAGVSEAAAAVAQAEAVGGAPAAGEGRAAEVVEGAAVREVKLPDGGDVPLRPAGDALHDGVDHIGDRVGTFSRPAADTPVLDIRLDATGFLDGAGAVRGAAARMARRSAVVMHSGRDDFLPLSGPVIDPGKVPGIKVAKVTAPQLRRHGRTFVAGEEMSIDFRAHTELVPIGAIEATPWHDLPDHDPD